MSVKKNEKIVSEIIYYCDICEKQLDTLWRRSCCKCGRDICKEHSIVIVDNSDYPDKWCVECWNITETLRKKLEEEEFRHDQIQEDIERELNYPAHEGWGFLLHCRL